MRCASAPTLRCTAHSATPACHTTRRAALRCCALGAAACMPHVSALGDCGCWVPAKPSAGVHIASLHPCQLAALCPAQSTSFLCHCRRVPQVSNSLGGNSDSIRIALRGRRHERLMKAAHVLAVQHYCERVATHEFGNYAVQVGATVWHMLCPLSQGWADLSWAGWLGVCMCAQTP